MPAGFPRPGRTIEASRAVRVADPMRQQLFGNRLRRVVRLSGEQWRRFFLKGPGTEFAFYPRLPQRVVELPIHGSIEPWDPDQDPERALSPYVDQLANLARGLPDVDGLALELSLAVAPDRRQSSARGALADLPRFAVDRLGWQRFLSVRWNGRPGCASIRIGRCEGRHWAPPGAWSFAEATLLPSDSRKATEAIANQIVAQGGWPGGESVDVEVSYRLAPDRDWTALWNTTLRALSERGSRGRATHLSGDPIVAVGLHRRIDEEMGDRARIGIWWHAVPGDGTGTARPLAVAAGSRDPRPGPIAMPPAFLSEPVVDAETGTAAETLGVDETHPPPTIPSAGEQDVLVFVNDDDSYLRWITNHPDGYALSAIRRAGAATLHRAACRQVGGDPSGSRRLTHNSAKVCCGSPDGLVRWARRELGADPSPCRICRPFDGGGLTR